jgi:DASS family divalent anion:Na+ symporter
MPTPSGVDVKAWKLFIIFISAIVAVIVDALPIITASILALSIEILTDVLKPKEAFMGFSEGFILLIVASFLIAKAVITSGLGKRVAFLIIRKFGKSSLGLAYSIIGADMIIAPAFPSNTARSGVLFPIVKALAVDSGSNPDEKSRHKLGSFLMLSSMAGITLSSSLWLTAMAANPAGAKMAEKFGIHISYMMWVSGAILPVTILFFLIPFVIYKLFPPQLKETPEAPKVAEEALKKMGGMSRDEKIMAGVFLGMVGLWIASSIFGVDKTAVAFLGLGILMVTEIFTLEDMAKEGGALSTLIWFAVLYSMSLHLNKFGFMGWIGEHISDAIGGFHWIAIYLILVISYVLIHYFFVSQTAQMLALFPVFLGVAVDAGVPSTLMALMLLFATNFNAVISPQGSSANVIYAGSGYLTGPEIYRIGGVVTFVNTTIFLTIGTFWILLVSKIF